MPFVDLEHLSNHLLHEPYLHLDIVATGTVSLANFTLCR